MVTKVILKGDSSAEQICLKRRRMLNTTELISLIPVSITFMFTESHRLTGMLEVVQSFCQKVAKNCDLCYVSLYHMYTNLFNGICG